MFKKTIKNLLILIGLILPGVSAASFDSAWAMLKDSRGSVGRYPQIVRELVSEKMYFATIPYIKEYLTVNKGAQSEKVDSIIDEVVTRVGVKQFEVLPIRTLQRSQAPTLRYILAKKYFRLQKYNKALAVLDKGIPTQHPVRPFTLLLRASIHSIMKKFPQAIELYKACTKASESQMSRFKDTNRERQLEINRDYCVIGIARAEFASRKYEEANLTYLDLPKSSHIWPEILFEEAWNSFYLKDYNRTLGKLVTYNAPVLSHIFNPEIEVLKGLAYLRLCLYDDVRVVTDRFYKEYENPHNGLKRLLKQNGRNFKFYYLLAKSHREGQATTTAFVNRLLRSIVRDPTYKELYDSFLDGRKELDSIARVSNKKFQSILNENLKDSLVLQRNLIGAYVRKRLKAFDHQLAQTFQGLSYLNLEVLSRVKRDIYLNVQKNRERGDIKYLKRNDKQYFWTFNGEFWADELGDYVFALRSEC